MAEKVPGWLERILLPRLSDKSGEVKAIYGKTDSTNAKIDSPGSEVRGELKAFRVGVEGEFKSVHSELRRLDGRIDGIEKRLDLSERVITLEAEGKALKGGKT